MVWNEFGMVRMVYAEWSGSGMVNGWFAWVWYGLEWIDMAGMDFKLASNSQRMV